MSGLSVEAGDHKQLRGYSEVAKRALGSFNFTTHHKGKVGTWGLCGLYSSNKYLLTARQTSILLSGSLQANTIIAGTDNCCEDNEPGSCREWPESGCERDVDAGTWIVRRSYPCRRGKGRVGSSVAGRGHRRALVQGQCSRKMKK